MNSNLLLRKGLPLLALLTLSFYQQTLACGYSYISDCATTIDLEVNGATSTYQVSNCPYLTVFNNHNFGALTSFTLAKTKSQTWESCDNFVMNARFHYRIYLQSGTAGSFNILPTTQLSTITNGAYRNRTREGFPSLNLLAGLNPGNYFIEIYFDSDVDFDNNGVPNVQIAKNNNGTYYKASFTVPSNQGGSLNVQLASKTNVTCNGGTNGTASVNVANGTAPITFAWSNGATTASITNLAAGNYTVTATDAGSNSGTLIVNISQPSTLLANVTGVDETSASANNGTATAAPTGGTPPYSFLWSTGATVANITGLNSGTYSVTVTDGAGCTKTGSVLIAVSGSTPTNYCASKGDQPWLDWITGVKLNSVDNASGKNQYTFYSTTSTDLNTGTSYTITLKNGFSWQTYNEYWRVWIDYNRNGTFEEPAEIAFSGILNAPALGTPESTTTGTVIVPSSADPGLTRMRVSLKRGAYATPCETIPFGEVEDYPINLVNGGPVPCSITATVANITCNDNGTNTVTTDDTYTFSLTVNGNGTGASWQTTIAGQPYSGNYGASVTAGPLPISGGVLNFTVQDAATATCTVAKSVTPPAPCSSSNPCAISASASSPICSSNGTPNDPGDDTYTFNLTVTGTNTGTGWTATVLGSSASGSYNIPTQMGPYLISAGNLSFTVKDAGTATCTSNVSVTPPNTCSNGGGGATYCAATSAFPWHDWIAGVAFGTVSNPSSKTAYSDFTGLSGNATQGSSLPITLTSGFSWFTYTEYWRVWIDYNHDGDFLDPEETAFSFVQNAPPNGTLEAPINGTIAIPASALTGPTRMRVIMKRGAAPTSCETIPNGEVEDYTINISSAFGGETGNRALGMQLNAVNQVEAVDLYAVLETQPEAATWRLEKSRDNGVFEPLFSGQVAAEEAFIVLQEADNEPFEGENFYKLTLFDRHGDVLSERTTATLFERIPDFEVFPNPANTEVFVELSKLQGQNVDIEIFNQVGRTIHREVLENVNEKTHRITLDGWRDGLYFLVIHPENKWVLTKKFMVGRL